MELTEEGQRILDASRTGKSFRIKALAGTGKTTSATVIAGDDPSRRVLYLGFNNSTAREGERRFARNTKVLTWHGLAHRAIGWKYRDRLSNNGWEIKRAVGELVGEKMPTGGLIATDRYTMATMDALLAFMQSGDRDVTEAHVPCEYQKMCDFEVVRDLARHAWSEMARLDSKMPISHDVYLKLFQLSEPKLQADLVLVDEFQDSNPVNIAILRDQSNLQRIVIGDDHQALYSWRGAVNALDEFDWPALPLTKSYRFNDAIARVPNLILAARQSPYRLTGGGDPNGYVCRESDEIPTAVLTRTNAGMVGEALTMLGQRVADGEGGTRPVRLAFLAFIGGVERVTGSILGAFKLYDRGRSSHPNFRLFTSWSELVTAAETTHAGSLRPFVKLVEKYKFEVPSICDRIRRETVSEEHADVVLSTTHMVKGRGYDRVRVGSDFAPFVTINESTGKIEMNVEEANVSYVALTRAQKSMDLGGYFPVLQESLKLASALLRGQTHAERPKGEERTSPRRPRGETTHAR